jgi:RNA polymerase sigma-70 factor, ECF subfamily
MARAALQHGRSTPEGPGRAWMWAIARNLLWHWYRTGRVEQRGVRRLRFDPAIPDQALVGVLDRAAADAMRDALASALASLTPLERETVQLRVLEHRSYPELARLHGCPVSEAQKRYSRAISKLRRAMPAAEAYA